MLAVILLVSLLSCLPSQEATYSPTLKEPIAQESDSAPFNCAQSTAEQELLIREAVENQYTIRRVTFNGNERTRDDVLRRRMLFQEGDIFARKNLVSSLKNVSKLKKIISPVKLSDVIISLEKSEKFVDMTICFKEKRK